MFEKADAAEFFQSILELLHFCLNQKADKKTIEDSCDTSKGGSRAKTCDLHRCVHLPLYTLSSGQGNQGKPVRQDFDRNNFMYIVNAQEVIDSCTQMLGRDSQDLSAAH